eukprot:scaffold3998_cov61-Phaeocystis_antarctica.AAC.1
MPLKAAIQRIQRLMGFNGVLTDGAGGSAQTDLSNRVGPMKSLHLVARAADGLPAHHTPTPPRSTNFLSRGSSPHVAAPKAGPTCTGRLSLGDTYPTALRLHWEATALRLVASGSATQAHQQERSRNLGRSGRRPSSITTARRPRAHKNLHASHGTSKCRMLSGATAFGRPSTGRSCEALAGVMKRSCSAS